MQAQHNVTVVYDTATGQPKMVVVDAQNLSDPAWNPPGHAHIKIDPATYNAMKAEDLHAHINAAVSLAKTQIASLPADDSAQA